MLHGRLHWYTPDELNEPQRAYYDALVNGPRGKGSLTDEQGRLVGAFNARLLDPAVGDAIQRLGATLRFETEIDDRMREIAVLEVAASERCNFEWRGHAAAALRAGASEAIVESIRTGTDCADCTEDEALARRVVRALIRDRDLDDELFAQAEQQLGLTVLFDLISLVGHYQHTALALRVWRVPLRPGTVPAFRSNETE